MRCHCTSGVGVCGRMWIGQYILSLPKYMLLCMISYSEVMFVVHVKYCNYFIGCGYSWCGMQGIRVLSEKCQKI